MRLLDLELAGFRGFPQLRRFDLDADAVIVVGQNGQGKTSLFDGILWVISGTVPRLGDSVQSVVSKYSESGEARGVLKLRLDNGGQFVIVRRHDGTEQQVRVQDESGDYGGDEAIGRIARELWPSWQASSNSANSLATLLSRSVYLQQDLVRQFLEGDDDQERFRVVSELVGTGRITEMQHQLERARQAWTRATNVSIQEKEQLEDRRGALEMQVQQLESRTGHDEAAAEGEWQTWWSEATQLGVTRFPELSRATADAGSKLDAAVKQLQVIRRTAERRLQVSSELLGELGRTLQQPTVPIESLQRRLREAERNVAVAREALAESEQRAADRRRAQVAERERSAELRALAELALRHLEDRCPVCQQAYDVAGTRGRLEGLARSAEEMGRVQGVDDVAAAAATVADAEKSVADALSQLRAAELAWREYEERVADRTRRLEELGLEGLRAEEMSGRLESAMAETAAKVANVRAHEESGERLALALAAVSQGARRDEAAREVGVIRARLADLERSIQARETTGNLASLMIDGLREAGSEIVRERLAKIEPVLQRIYARMDPHPTFRVVRFLAQMSYGRGRLRMPIEDATTGIASDTPEIVLSSSQMNSLAVAVFLAFNIALPTVPLRSAILDDPLQSLDDINLLGVIDLLRRAKETRQLLLSTHDSKFAGLLERKLRPVRPTQRTVVVELDDWGRDGPSVRQRDVRGDPKVLHLAAQPA